MKFFTSAEFYPHFSMYTSVMRMCNWCSYIFSVADKLPEGVISPIVVQCIAYLNREHILKEPGLFRIPGDLSVMKKYRAEFARGQ